MVAIHEWHAQELAKDYELGRVRMVTGCPLYGEPYVTDFINYCLPTILSLPQNWDALEDQGFEYVLFVDGPAEARLQGLPSMFRLRRLPDDLAAQLHANPGLKYPLLAAAHNLLIHKARDIGAGFHMTVADTIYCEGYFARLLELAETHEAIAQTGFAIVGATGLPVIGMYRIAGQIGISARVLGEIGWEHLNPQWMSWNMDGITDFEEMPNSHYIHFRGRDSVRIHCAHLTATWIGPERCRKVEHSLGGTVDSELPRYMAGDFYAPKLSDEMVYVVIAGASAPTPRIPWAEYKAEFWRFIGNDRPEPDNAFLPYFRNPCPLPVPYDGNCPDDPELDERLGRLMDKLHA